MFAKRFLVLGLLAGSTLLLSACIDRDEANAKLASGCEAAAKHMTNAPFELKEVKNVAFEEVSFGEDTGLRQVKMDIVESDGWMTRNKTYTCVFSEFLGFFNMSHKADLYRVEIGNSAFGKGGGGSSGEGIDEWLQIRDAAKSGLKGS